MKKVLVIYDSKFGNTEKIAKALVTGMQREGITAEYAKVEEVDIDKLTEYDLLAVGGPTHMRTASKPMKAFLEKLDRIDVRGKKAFAFDTKVEFRLAGSAGKAIEKKLQKLHMNIVKPHTSAIVMGNEGPLKDGEEEAFKQIGSELTESL